MNSDFCRSVVFAGVSLMIAAPAGAQVKTTPEMPDVRDTQPPVDPPPEWVTLPGEFALRTRKGYYVTAVNGGGRATDPVMVTATMLVTPWEKFRLSGLIPSPLHDKSIQTSRGHYVTAVDGGGHTADVVHTDATQISDWERFRLHDLSVGGAAPTYFALQTIHGNYLTAVGEGGKYDNAIHTDATQLGSWEQFRIVKCGDLGTGYQYTILAADGQALIANEGGGLADGTPIYRDHLWPGGTFRPAITWARFGLIRQNDGSYALQTANGVHYVTALGGGGLVQQYLGTGCEAVVFGACLAGSLYTDIFHTDATQVQPWEKFRFIDQGDCKYTIQTTSGFFFGIYKGADGWMAMTTRRSTVSENEKFQLVMHGLASPPVLRRVPDQQQSAENPERSQVPLSQFPDAQTYGPRDNSSP